MEKILDSRVIKGYREDKIIYFENKNLNLEMYQYILEKYGFEFIGKCFGKLVLKYEDIFYIEDIKGSRKDIGEVNLFIKRNRIYKILIDGKFYNLKNGKYLKEA